MILFTESNAYMYDQSTFKKVWATGCSSWRTIVNSGPYMFFSNADGQWMTSGGTPQNIAGPMIDFFRNGNPRDFFSACVDEEIHTYVGTVTVQGVTYTNCALIFNLQTQTYRTREYANPITSFARKNESGVNKLYMGGATYVWEKGKHSDSTLVSSDDGSNIAAYIEFAPMYIGNLTYLKESSEITAFCDRAQGVKMKYRVLDRNSRILTPYMPLGELTKYVNNFKIDIDKGVLIQLCLSEYSTNPYFSFYGYELDLKKAGEIV
jgi:hypothetical protein